MFLVVPPGGQFREPRRIELGARVLTIGRAESCDVRVDVPGVDDQHAKISEVAFIAVGADCAIGDVPLDTGSRRLVTPGDEIQIGSIVVVLEGDDPDAPRPLGTGTAEIPSLGMVRPQGPRIRVVEGANFGDELVLKEEGREYVIGRNAKCDLVLEDREVSREHIKLVRRGYQVFLQDLSSTRGSWLGRSAVYSGSKLEWARPRMLRVGASVLSLELPDIIRKAAPGPQASAPHTPEPRRQPAPTPLPAPVTHAPSSPPVSASQPPPPPDHQVAPMAPRAPYAYHDAPTGPPPALPGVPMQGPMPVPATPMPVPPAATSSAPMIVSPPPSGVPAHKRAGWKASGPTISKGSGVLLLALAAIAVLGALFVVFSLLE